MRPIVFFITFFVLILAFAPWQAVAAQVVMSWNPSPSPGVVGYRIYYGSKKGTHTASVSVGNNCSATISGLTPGLTYYFVVTALTISGDESTPSNEASYAVPKNTPSSRPLTHAATASGKKQLDARRIPAPQVLQNKANSDVLNVATPTLHGQPLTCALATVTGTAGGNGNICGVWYQFNHAAWKPAATKDHWTNWNITTPLVAGTNTLIAYAMDAAGNCSATSSVSVFSSSTFKLQLNLETSRPFQAGSPTFTLQQSGNLNGHIECSTNLLDWRNWTNFEGTNSIITFRDPTAVNSPRRFYRAVVP
jgi:hypothetical protein